MIKLDDVKQLHLAYFVYKEEGKYNDNKYLEKARFRLSKGTINRSTIFNRNYYRATDKWRCSKILSEVRGIWRIQRPLLFDLQLLIVIV